MAFKTLQVYHFAQLPKEAEQNINGIIQDITPYDTLYEGSCDEINVYGPDDMQLMGKAMYNEAKRELMKEAVEGEIQMRYSGCLCAKTIRAINEDKFKLGDKGHIIFVKEEEK